MCVVRDSFLPAPPFLSKRKSLNREAKIRVLVVDDDRMVRRLLIAGLQEEPRIEVVGEAGDPYAARDKIVELKPDVMTLDVEMPRMNGLDFLRKLIPQYPLPVIMVSSLTDEGRYVTLESLKSGAFDFVPKPNGSAGGYTEMIEALRQKILLASQVDIVQWIKLHGLDRSVKQLGAPEKSDKYNLIAFGASTGGTQALGYILQRLPEKIPGIVAVQHMPPGFTQAYAASLNRQVLLDVKEADTLDLVAPGRVLIAPGDIHMAIKEEGSSRRINLFNYEKVSGHRPSVDVLFHSIAETSAARHTIAVLLTGMGKDGAKGLLALREAGARTLIQDEQSSVVFGMPQAARDLEAAEREVPLSQMAETILSILGEPV